MRFVMCISVLLYHLNIEYDLPEKMFGRWFSFFGNGRNGVEFFFIVSGFLMAKSAFKRRGDGVPVGKSTVLFLWGKIKRLFPPHIIVVLLTAAYIIMFYRNPVLALVSRLASVLFLQNTGVGLGSFIGVEWYISSMLIAMAIIYPLLRANYDVTARAVAPIGSLLIMGYLIQTYACLPNSTRINGLTYSSNLRAIGVMLLGVCAFEASRLIKSRKLLENHKVSMIALENLCYIIFIYYICSNFSTKYNAIAAMFCACAVAITFSREDMKLYNNKLIYLLGELALPVYLVQNIVRKIVLDYVDVGDVRKYKMVLFTTALCLASGVAVHYTVRLYYLIKTKVQKSKAAKQA